jgi:hypothetical protein
MESDLSDSVFTDISLVLQYNLESQNNYGFRCGGTKYGPRTIREKFWEIHLLRLDLWRSAVALVSAYKLNKWKFIFFDFPSFITNRRLRIMSLAKIFELTVAWWCIFESIPKKMWRMVTFVCHNFGKLRDTVGCRWFKLNFKTFFWRNCFYQTNY